MRHTLSATLGLLSLGCMPVDQKADTGAAPSGPPGMPELQVTPVLLDFGRVPVGADDTPGMLQLDLVNVGEADLHVDTLRFTIPDGPFSVSSDGPWVVPPNQSKTLIVSFTPQRVASVRDVLEVVSDNPSDRVYDIPVAGLGVGPELSGIADTTHFGTAVIGCEVEHIIPLTNTGNTTLEVTDVRFDSSSSELTLDTNEAVNGPLPWSIAPDASVGLTLRNRPLDVDRDEGVLTVQSTDPLQPVQVALVTSEGRHHDHREDTRVQPTEGKVDVVFAVDRGGSMYQENELFQDAFGHFVEALRGTGADFRVTATVEDNGCINGDHLFIDDTLPPDEVVDTVVRMVNLGGSYSTNIERAFMLLEANLAQDVPGGCNEGFGREDASLHLVGVSDEREQSVNHYTHYLALFQSHKDNPANLVMHAIGGDYPAGCGSAEPYLGFYEATVATSGQFHSICTNDWGTSLATLAHHIPAGLTTLPLTALPVPETIHVTVDGTDFSAWSYAPATNSVAFHPGGDPPGGSTVTASYAVLGECGG